MYKKRGGYFTPKTGVCIAHLVRQVLARVFGRPGNRVIIDSMKPDTSSAMAQLIRQIRDAIPFDMPEAYACTDNCNGCSMKLLEFLDMELLDWERRLAEGERPNFGDIQRIARMARKIHRVLLKNGLVDEARAV